jgi:hypothetical protein
VSFRLLSIDEADTEFLALPAGVRETFIASFRELMASAYPICSGSDWYVEELRQNQRLAPEGLFSLHVGSLWRGAFYRRGTALIFIGFGYRLPEFYDKLTRLRNALSQKASGESGDV